MDRYLFVLIGGAAGCLARYITAINVTARFPGRFPVGTLVVNTLGCFLIGLLLPALGQKGAAAHWRLLLVTGFLGGYTTFSAFAFETYALVRGGSPWIGLANVLISVTVGYFAVWLGARITGS
jgi:fluoride exporter